MSHTYHSHLTGDERGERRSRRASRRAARAGRTRVLLVDLDPTSYTAAEYTSRVAPERFFESVR
jgi:hypothetical protein